LAIGIIALLLQALAFATADVTKGSMEWITWLLIIFTLPSQFIMMLFSGSEAMFYIGRYLPPVIYFVIGAIIGGIMQVIKRK